MDVEPAPQDGTAPLAPPSVEARARPSGSGAWVAAAIVLFLVGVASVAYNGWDLVILAEDLAVFDRAGIGSVGSALLAIDVGLVVSGLLQMIGAIIILARRSRDRVLALAGCVGTLLAWVAFLALVLGRNLMAGVSVGAWMMLLVTTSGSVLGAGLLLTRRNRGERTEPNDRAPSRAD